MEGLDPARPAVQFGLEGTAGKAPSAGTPSAGTMSNPTQANPPQAIGTQAIGMAGPAGRMRVERSEVHMGTQFTIILYAENVELANRAVAAAFARIAQLESSLSDYRSDSEVSRLGQQSPMSQWVPIQGDLAAVLDESQRLHRGSGGAFDVTVGPLTKLWRRAVRRGQPPEPARLADALNAVGWEHVRLFRDPGQRIPTKIMLLRPQMRLDLGGIAKGYAVDQAGSTLQQHGLSRWLVNGGGDLVAGDAPPGKSGWEVLTSPLGREREVPASQKWAARPQKIVLRNAAVATSGDAWKFVEFNGKRYSHIVDPDTGLGIETLGGVSVVAPTCMEADGLASTVLLLGLEKGLQWISRQEHYAARMVELRPPGIRVRQTWNWPGRESK